MGTHEMFNTRSTAQTSRPLHPNNLKGIKDSMNFNLDFRQYSEKSITVEFVMFEGRKFKCI